MERFNDICLTAQESWLVEQLLQQSKNPDILDARTAFWLFSGDKSNLPNPMLGHIWDICDIGKKGHLTSREVGATVRLIGWAQDGREIEEHLVHEPGPVASLAGISPKDTPKARNASPLPPLPSPGPPAVPPRHTRASSSTEPIRAPPLTTHSRTSSSPSTSTSPPSLLSLNPTGNVPFPQPPIVLTPPSPPPSPPPPIHYRPPPSPSVNSGTSSTSPSSVSDFSPFEDSPTQSPDSSPRLEFRPLSSKYRERYQSAFQQAGPVHGLLLGPKAWRLFLRSRLPVDILLQIWDCASPLERPNAPPDLNLDEFTLIMYLIHGLMDGVLGAVPQRSQVPLDVRPKPRTNDEHATPDLVTQISARAFSLDFRRYIKAEEDQPVLPVLPPEIQGISAQYFDSLVDTEEGRISGDVAQPFLSVSELSLEDLAHIWDLADYDHQGSLDSKGFAVALFLVYKRMAEQGLTDSLPPTFLASTRKSKQRDRGSPDLVLAEDRRLRSLSVMQPDNKHLLSQIADLRASLEARTLENDALRKSNAHNEKGEHARELLDELSNALQEKDILIRKLREARDENASHRMTNEILQNQLNSVKEQLRISRVDTDTMTQMLREDLERETGELRRQIEEMRESSTSVPSSGGDEDLQQMINEQLSRENGQLRKQVHELQDGLAKISMAQEPVASTSSSASAPSSASIPATPRASSMWWSDSRPREELPSKKGKEKETEKLEKRKTKLKKRDAEILEKLAQEHATQEEELKRQIQELESKAAQADIDMQQRLSEAQSQSQEREASLRRRVEQLGQENESLRRRPVQQQQSAAPPPQPQQPRRDDDVAPPAYTPVA